MTRPAAARILMYVDECIWPISSGFHRRAWQLIDGLKDIGAEVHLVSRHGSRPRRCYWTADARAHLQQQGIGLELAPFGLGAIDFWLATARWLGLKLLLRRPFIPAGSSYYSRPQLMKLWRQKLVAGPWAAVVINHAVNHRLARAARLAGIPTFLEMHDLLTSQAAARWRTERGTSPASDYLESVRSDELSCLGEADYVLAINPEEAANLRVHLKVPVIDLPFCLPDTRPKERVEPTTDLLVVGSGIQFNRNGLSAFLAHAWSKIKTARPGVRLTICGGVGEVAAPDPNITWHSHVQDLSPFYHRTRIALLVSTDGSGIKIKTIEAMAHGCCIVSHVHSVTGTAFVDGLHGKVVTDFDDEAANVILSLLGDTGLREGYQRQAHALFLQEYELERSRHILRTLFPPMQTEISRNGNFT